MRSKSTGADRPVGDERIIENSDFSEKTLPGKEYEECTFLNCNFYNSDLSRITFTCCLFDGCDLSLAKINDTVFNDIEFKNSKLLGLHFDDCNDLLLTLDFENCRLNLASFYKLNLKKTRFVNCSVNDADFSGTDLTASLFDNCDLKGTTFSETNLEKADFRTSFNFSIDPEKNRIRKAKFSSSGLAGLLDKYDIDIE
jgi:fluoroquinolone resistance protein